MSATDVRYAATQPRSVIDELKARRTAETLSLIGVLQITMASPLSRFPFFPSLARRMIIDGDDRVELSTRTLEPELVEAVLHLTTPCCRCGSPIHPFRRRGPGRRNALTSTVYVSLVCPQSENPGCSRGKAAEAAKAALIEDVINVYDADNAEFLPAFLR